MCGRAAQSRNAVQIGAESLIHGDKSSSSSNKPLETSTSTRASSSISSTDKSGVLEITWNDNWNLAPGMDSIVYLYNETSSSSQNNIQASKKVWGIIPKSGTCESPLPIGPNKHFSHLMYNARSETLYEKRTFRNLALKGNVRHIYVESYFFSFTYCTFTK